MPQTPGSRFTDDQAVPYTPTAEVLPGSVVTPGVGTIPLFSAIDIPANQLGALQVRGAITLPKDASVVSFGQNVYWNATGNPTVGTAGTGCASTAAVGPLIGWAIQAQLAGDANVTVILMAGAQNLISVAQNPTFPRNLIDGGDMTINPMQRGTAQTADITNTVTYGPDRFFFLAGAASALDWSQVADASVLGFSNSLKMQRKSGNTDLTTLILGQVLESADAVSLQGQQVTLSFWARTGANYSGGALTVQLNHSTTAGNDTAAHLAAASTNWQATPTIVNTTQTLTGTMTRYSFTGTVPNTATQVGMILKWTPTGTAGADDSIVVNGFQLEVAPAATPFEHHDIEMELARCQRYYVQFSEPASGNIVAAGHNSATNVQTFVLGLPTQMRVSPTVTVTVGTFKVNSAGAGVVAATGLAASGTHTPTQIGLTSTGTGTAGQGATLQGGGGTGLIAVSADL